MSLRRSLLILIALPFLICVSWDQAQADSDVYAQALEKTRTLIRDLKSYQVQGSLTISNSAVGTDQSQQMEVTLHGAARWPDRLLNVQTSDMFFMNSGTGPDQSWFFLSQQQVCYQGAPVQLNRDLEALKTRELENPAVFNFLAGLQNFLLPDNLTDVQDDGLDTIQVGDQTITCRVLRQAGPPREDEEMPEGKTYWVDSESGLVLKGRTIAYGQRGPTETKQTMNWQVASFSLDESVKDEDFSFTPAQDVVVVSSLAKILNPDSMVGELAPDITFTDFEGNKVQLSDYRGKVVFLDFWATWCPPCKKEMPHLEALHQEFDPSGEVVFIGASNEAQATIEGFLAKNPYTFKMVLVSQEDAVGKYKAKSIPAGFVIDRDGVIQAHVVGAQTEAQLRAALAKAGIE